MSESISIKVVDDTTLVLTDDWLTDYIRLTGDPERPWYFLDGQTLPLTQYVRECIDKLALARVEV